MVGGAVVIPRGTDATLQSVKVQQSGKMKGSDLIQLKVFNLVMGTTCPVVSSAGEFKGPNGRLQPRKTIGGAGLGALIRRYCRWRQRRTHRNGGGSGWRCEKKLNIESQQQWPSSKGTTAAVL